MRKLQRGRLGGPPAMSLVKDEYAKLDIKRFGKSVAASLCASPREDA